MNLKKQSIFLLVILFILNQVAFSREYPLTEEVLQKIEAAIPKDLGVNPSKKKKILIYTKCGGFQHNSRNVGVALFEAVEKYYPNLDFTHDNNIESYSLEKLNTFDMVLNINATHSAKTFGESQKKALLDFIKSGKCFMGIHAASDAGNWPEYTEMIGGNFAGHPWNSGGTWDFIVDGEGHPVTGFLGSKFSHREEIFRHKNVPEGIQYLISLDPNSEANTLNIGKEAPYIFTRTYGAAWLKKFGKGRVFYSSFGHRPESFWDSQTIELYLRGINFILK